MNREHPARNAGRVLARAAAALALTTSAHAPAAEPPKASFAPVVAAPAAAAFPLESPPPAPPPLAPPPVETAPAPIPVPPRVSNRDVVIDRQAEDDDRDLWMLSAEGVTRAPIDVGAQAIFETPIGVRLGGGFGWMPSPYLDLISNVAQLASTTDVATRFDSGRVLRAQIGLRPFRTFGAYVDGGYARADIEGHLVDPSGLVGARSVSSELDLWFVELGYQSTIADRVVLAVGIGVTGVIDAQTSTPETADASSSSEAAAATDSATATVDATLEHYGYVPTLTLRLGLDLI